MNTTTLLVRQDALATTTLRSTEPTALADGQVRVRVDRFALTANNITYAAMGEMLEYWRFFPSGEADWGRSAAFLERQAATTSSQTFGMAGRFSRGRPS